MCSQSNMDKEAQETRYGKAVRSAPSHLHLRTQLVLWGALGLGWNFRDVSNWDQEAECLCPHINQSLDVGGPRKSVRSWKRQFILVGKFLGRDCPMIRHQAILSSGEPEPQS